jgi:hypothetical protein
MRFRNATQPAGCGHPAYKYSDLSPVGPVTPPGGWCVGTVTSPGGWFVGRVTPLGGPSVTHPPGRTAARK